MCVFTVQSGLSISCTFENNRVPSSVLAKERKEESGGQIDILVYGYGVRGGNAPEETFFAREARRVADVRDFALRCGVEKLPQHVRAEPFRERRGARALHEVQRRLDDRLRPVEHPHHSRLRHRCQLLPQRYRVVPDAQRTGHAYMGIRVQNLSIRRELLMVSHSRHCICCKSC